MVLRRRKRNLKSVGAEADRGPLYVPLRDLPKAALTVKLVTPNLKTQVPRALDIGYFGMLIEFDSSKFSDLAFGSPVELRLRHRRQACCGGSKKPGTTLSACLPRVAGGG